MIKYTITLQDEAELGFVTDFRKRTEALHDLLKQERAAHKAESEITSKKIRELEEENALLKRRRRITSKAVFDEIRYLRSTVQQLTDRLEAQDKIIAWFKKQYFGHKTEQAEALALLEAQPAGNTPVQESQPSPNDEPTTPTLKSKPKRGQQPGSTGHGRTRRSNLEVEEIFIDIPNCACDVCNAPYRLLSTTADSTVMEVNVKPHVRKYRRRKYVSQCDCKGKRIVTAPAESKLYPRSEIGNSLWVYLLIWKYLFSVPTSRILNELSLHGLELSAGTVTGGLAVIDKALKFLYEKIADHCRGGDLWNADETTWRVLEDNNGARCSKQWWFWLIASNDAVVYLLDKGRTKEVPVNFFAGSNGVLMTDRLASYKALSDSMQKAWCWVHMRRDFLKIFEGMPSLREWAKEWLQVIGMLFAFNHIRLALWQCNQSSGAEWEQAQKTIEDHVKLIKARFEQQLTEPNLHKAQKKVLGSLMRHWDGLTLFLQDPRIPLTNNRAERLLRNVVVNRKNSYGSGKEWTGYLAAKLFTIFQTWLVNGLNPQALLLDYLNECSKARGQPPPDLSSFLPWEMSEDRKQLFSIPKNIKLPA